jgi:hypothetical protein
MERFLQYSLFNRRKIRAVLMLNGKLTQKTVTVLALGEEFATLLLTAKKAPVTLTLNDILSCDYARGDHGED